MESGIEDNKQAFSNILKTIDIVTQKKITQSMKCEVE
jgi:hypothetical protein